MLPKLNLPAYSFRFQESEGKLRIFDEIRKKFVVLTPEEWVRQNITQYLILEKKYLRIRFSMETGLELNKLRKRSDIIIHNHDGSIYMIVECKAPEIKMNESTLDQALRYNQKFKSELVVLTNGIEHFCWKVNYETGTVEVLNGIPEFSK